jgi:membrane protease YdiL (CAAX protease family)
MTLKPGGIKIWHTLLILPCLLLLQLFYGIIAAVIASIFHYPFEKDLALLGLINTLSIGLVVFICLLIYRIPWRQAVPTQRTPWAVYPALLVTVLGLEILLSELDNVLRYFFHIPIDTTILNGIQFNPWAAALTLVVIAPLTEEILFRGLILQGFYRQYSAKVAVLVSALLFGAIHFNWQQIPGAAALGILLGWTLLKTGSILPCLFIHALNNGLVLAATLVSFNIPGFSGEPDPTVSAVFQPLWFDALGLLLFALGCWALRRIIQRAKRHHSAPPIGLGAEG